MLAWAAGHGVDALALRLSWIYGPGRRTPTTLETLILNSLRGRTTVIDGRPSDPTHYIHVEDAVDALVSAAMTNSVRQRIYNATGGAALAFTAFAIFFVVAAAATWGLVDRGGRALDDR